MSPAKPTWTRARLLRVMTLRFGVNAHGGPDTVAAAAAMGVSQRTVQRWLHGAHGRSLAHIPPARLAQLMALLQPDPGTIAREAQQARYAAKAIGGLHLGRKAGIKPAWEKQGWLDQHLVVVLEIKVGAQRIRQLAVSRSTVSKTEELKKRGRIIDQAVVPTRFHATVLTHKVLTDVGPWRFQAGADQVLQGYTQSWLADGPVTHLSRDAHRIIEEKENR
ncbi:hypothetical protein Xcel_3409 (plasmid) [Xylanimonas cellulosilytica DSM 15894]|uniref:Uncharacterized protein n=1 Tax=Xylanimonas cellulosilytica (strain DSM 15894 / JCM 12276 / CECT 5975 / KCTC 9989 / LMG 20990 / NBRC 107835 / XIL07) TaxID=446471 RepID=D1C0U2_XYLCX|nr:hypothetical protein [Xylanimonas cellulosilytica]ACZ32408.1 hypothetical protein Xcel_3409 [Xylanimonas cellulosilytica DSM 15894]